ncbi:thioesterase II family protein [Streptomyces pseudovenezuelae]|uniref:thioesterase II family protein n=1 Tax=Streptomyces pseudovenezuelae TaxID=67350 RepID=UPI002E8112BA|nr:alpha/beta fold hydrolase [Streptomyces pseudovenezuelae]WUA87516.1 alpha/beta fold hydrolase [Streptomyces pseudovenezuelae]
MSGTWIRRLRPSGPGTAQVLCFPYAGGAANGYSGLAHALSPDVEVFAVQYPGRQDRFREAPAQDFQQIIEHVLGELPSHCDPGKPLALFGHSMGALLAFETGRCLQQTQSPFTPIHLFLSGRASPSLGRRPSDFLRSDATLVAELRRLGGADPQVLNDPEMLELIMPSIRADYRLLMQYSWDQGTLRDCPFTVLVGEEDPVVMVGEADQWRALTSGVTRTVPFSGGHFFLNQQAQQVAQVILSALSATLTGKFT